LTAHAISRASLSGDKIMAQSRLRQQLKPIVNDRILALSSRTGDRWKG
jgi:hypothetical protein